MDWLLGSCGAMDEVNVPFFGGEPLLNFSLLKQVVVSAKEAAEKRGKKITFIIITTNGSLLADEVIRANLDKLRAVFPSVIARGILHGDADPARMQEGMEEGTVARRLHSGSV